MGDELIKYNFWTKIIDESDEFILNKIYLQNNFVEQGNWAISKTTKSEPLTS